jgi:hypothetical protein
MLNLSRPLFIVLIFCLAASLSLAQQAVPSPTQAPSSVQQQPNQSAAPALDEWGDDFNGAQLDQTKWERFTFEGGGGGKFEVKDGQLKMRSMSGSRAGVRSKPTFYGDHFIIEATIGRVGSALPEPGSSGVPLGNAIVTVLFDSSGRNRIEWLWTSEGTLEAWSMVDGRGERLDNRKLAVKIKNPTLGIARKGDDFFFAINGEVGLQSTLKNLPNSFRVMLYGFGSSENNWDAIHVVTPKQSK